MPPQINGWNQLLDEGEGGQQQPAVAVDVAPPDSTSKMQRAEATAILFVHGEWEVRESLQIWARPSHSVLHASHIASLLPYSPA